MKVWLGVMMMINRAYEHKRRHQRVSKIDIVHANRTTDPVPAVLIGLKKP